MLESGKPVYLAINTMTGGGAENVVLELASNWPLPENPPVILLAERRGELLERVPEGLEVFEIGVPLGITKTPAFLMQLRRILSRRPPAAIISHLTQMNRMLLRAKVGGVIKTPLVIVEHNNPKHNLAKAGIRGALNRRETGWLYRQADDIIAVSNGVLGEVRDHYNLSQTSGRVIYNPINIDIIRLRATQHPGGRLADKIQSLPRPIFLSAGRLHPQKDFATLIKAFHSLPTERRGSLVILGEGELRQELEATVSNLELTNCVMLPGFVQNPSWFMAQADLFVMSSRWEGFGNVLVESMACGTPVLSTDCPYGPSEIICMFGCGKLVPVGDSIAMATKMEQMVCERPKLPDPLIFDKFDPISRAHEYTKLVSGGPLHEQGSFEADHIPS